MTIDGGARLTNKNLNETGWKSSYVRIIETMTCERNMKIFLCAHIRPIVYVQQDTCTDQNTSFEVRNRLYARYFAITVIGMKRSYVPRSLVR